MRASTELREPFLDHRLVELSLRQRPEYKIRNGTSKWLLRQLATTMLPDTVTGAAKRPLQTPQREWLRGPLRGWAEDCIESALCHTGGSWLDASAVRQAWQEYCAGQSDNSFYIWQWMSVGMMMESGTRIHG
jgi:asparagine synthase (glutamine-hydrolysing)